MPEGFGKERTVIELVLHHPELVMSWLRDNLNEVRQEYVEQDQLGGEKNLGNKT